MALPVQDKTGIAIPVTLAHGPVVDHLIVAAQLGYSTLGDGTKVMPVDFYTAILADPDDPTDPSGFGFWVVILNALPTPLSLVEMPALVHGYQKGYPAVSDLKGSTLTTHVIPAARSHPLDPSVGLCGVGTWAFDFGNGTEGAMALCYNGNLTDPQSQQAVGPFVGISWRIGLAWANRFAVTADVAGKYGTLDGFYQQSVVSASDSIRYDKSSEIVVMCHEWSADLQSGIDPLCSSMMVYIRNKLPNE
ncbi:MAG TPA: hypothetical protein VHE33_15825 [Acidobacteriaceae bacterium]|nr:hypothetical protein [Acidobacteriaceae bacterium]